MYVYKIQSPIGGAFGVEGQRRQEGEELSASLVSKDKIIVSIWNPVTDHIHPSADNYDMFTWSYSVTLYRTQQKASQRSKLKCSAWQPYTVAQEKQRRRIA